MGRWRFRIRVIRAIRGFLSRFSAKPPLVGVAMIGEVW
jgi:hypothetical protein